MKRVIFLLILLVFLPVFSTCYVSTPSSSNNLFEVQIISDPPGARIEVNDNYIGDAPLTVKIEGYSDRTFKKETIIVANPIIAGQYVQRKRFWGGYTRELNDRIPERILFIMNLNKAPTQYDIDINKK